MLIAVAFSLFASASAATVVTADQALNQYWRTSYDILVRAPSAITPIEQGHGLIEANYLSGTMGAISRAQWEQIRAIPDVQVAAPIAMVGYVYKAPPAISLLPGVITEPGLYRVMESTAIDNGYRPIVSNLVPYYSLYFDRINFDLIEREEFRNKNARDYRALGITPYGGNMSEEFNLALQPAFNDWLLIAAIDPTEEAKLLNLDQYITNGRYFREEEPIFEDEGRGYLPLLLNQQDYISTTDTIRVERLLLPFTPTSPYNGIPLPGEIESAGGIDFLTNASRETVWETTLSGRDGGRTVYAPLLEIAANEIEPRRAQLSYSYLDSEIRLPASVTYREVQNPPAFLSNYDVVLEAIPVATTSGAQFHPSGDTLVSHWLADREVSFRTLDPLPDTELGFLPDVIGSFQIEATDALGGASPNQVPLETYFPPVVTLLYDEAGNVITPPAPLRPTLNDEGYLVTPPEALTTLDNAYGIMSAAEMLDDDDGFISAIRVRVGGITELTPEAQARIETVAQQIVEETGLEVDIMVGSSPQRVMVHIPGYEGVPALGYVEEGWVKKGVATEVTRGLNRADTLLLSTMGISCLLYLFNAAFIGVLGRLPEFGMMRALGWRKVTLFGLVISEALFLGVLSGILGALVALLIVSVFQLPVPWQQVLLLIPVSGAAFAVGSILPAWQATRVPPSIVIRGGETATVRIPLPAGSSLWGYALGSVIRRPARTFATVGGLALSGGLLVVLYLVLVSLGGQLYGTLLGTWVRTALAPYHFAMGAVALLASGLAVAEVMTLNVTQRRREVGLLRALGWRQAALAQTFLLESAIVGILGGVLGTVLAIGLYYALQGTLPTDPMVWLVVIGLGVGVPLLTALVATLYPAIRAARMLPLEALRGEERLAPSGALTQTVTWLGVGATIVGTIIVALTWYVEGTPEPAPLVVAATPSVTATATLAPAPPAPPTPTAVNLQTVPHYAIDVIVDPIQSVLQGRETIEYTNETGVSLDTIALRLYPNTPFTLDSTADQRIALQMGEVQVEGQTVVASLVSSDTAALLPLPQPLAPGATTQIALDFTYTTPAIGTLITEGWIVSAFAPVIALYDGKKWQTAYCGFCDPNPTPGLSSNFTLRVTVPDGWQVAAPGVETITPEGDGGLTYRYEVVGIRTPSLAISRKWSVHQAVAGTTELLIYTPPNAPLPTALVDTVTQVLEEYTARFGAYPASTLRIIAEPYAATSGLSYPGLLLFRYPTDGAVDAQVIAREVARQWWEGTIGGDFYKEPWLAVTLVEYSAFQYVESVAPDTAQTLLASYAQQAARTQLSDENMPIGSRVSDFPDDGMGYYETMSIRGPLFLHALRQQIGDDAFFTGWQVYAAQHRFGIGTGLAFREAMEQASGKGLTPFFAEWGILGDIP